MQCQQTMRSEWENMGLLYKASEGMVSISNTYLAFAYAVLGRISAAGGWLGSGPGYCRGSWRLYYKAAQRAAEGIRDSWHNVGCYRLNKYNLCLNARTYCIQIQAGSENAGSYNNPTMVSVCIVVLSNRTSNTADTNCNNNVQHLEPYVPGIDY